MSRSFPDGIHDFDKCMHDSHLYKITLQPQRWNGINISGIVFDIFKQ